MSVGSSFGAAAENSGDWVAPNNLASAIAAAIYRALYLVPPSHQSLGDMGGEVRLNLYGLAVSPLPPRSI